MDIVFEQFHFIRPWWFIALLPTMLIAVLLHRHKKNNGQWNHYLPAHLAAVLVDQGDGQHKSRFALFIALGWIVCVLALAGPTWEKIDRPLFKVKQAHVVMVDMSLSMYATDIKPNRLTRAKYKLTDLIKQLGEGETALVAFAGDAFVISPMTSDVANLLNLLPSLNPSIMPQLGSRPDLAVERSIELLKQAQYSSGQLYLIADDLTSSQSRAITKALTNTNFELNIMAVGTDNGAPIKLPNEQLLKDDNGNIVIPQVPSALLANLASGLSGRFAPMSHDKRDITTLVTSHNTSTEQTLSTDQFGDRWQELGPYLLLILLPFVAFSCRKGMLQSVLLTGVFIASYQPLPSYAQEATAPSPDTTQQSTWWDNLWQTPNQQGIAASQANNHQQALTTLDDPKWRGASQYQLGQYQEALDSFEQSDDSKSLYNQGNALTQLGRYKEAINRYNKALIGADNTNDITQNISLASELLEQQKQQNKDQKGDNQQSDGDDKQQDNQQQDGDGESGDDQQTPQDQQNESANNKSDDQQSSESQQQKKQDGEQSSQESKQQNQESEQPDGEKKPSEQEKNEQQQQQAQAQAAKLNETFDKDNLSKEQLAHLNQLVNKINDDPSLLLKNKMAVEARKRQRQRLVKKETKNW